MAVQGPTATNPIDDDKYRDEIYRMNRENHEKWKAQQAMNAPMWEKTREKYIENVHNEREPALKKWAAADMEQRLKAAEKEKEMEMGGGGGRQPNMGAHFNHPQGGIHPMYGHQMGGGPPPNMGMYNGMPPMQPMQHVQHNSPMAATAPANGGSEMGTANARKRSSNTPNYEDGAKRMMMDGRSPSNPFGYPQGAVMDMKYPSNPAYGMMMGGPYGMTAPSYPTPPACRMELQQQQQVQQMQQAPPSSFPAIPPTSTASAVAPPQSSTRDESADLVAPDNVDDMLNAVGGSSYSGQDLGTDDLDNYWDGPSTSTGGGGEEGGEGGPTSNGGMVLPMVPPTSAPSSVPPATTAPLSNQMPTPGAESQSVGGGSSSTHASPINAFHPSPHSFPSQPINGLIHTVNSVGGGGGPSSVQSVSSVPSMVHPRTPTASVMGPPADSSTPFPHMAHASSLPPHLQSSFPISTSSHLQPAMLRLSPGAAPAAVAAPPPAATTAAPKSRKKKAAAPKQQAQPQQQMMVPQFPVNGMMPPGMAGHPSMYGVGGMGMGGVNQFAPPPGGHQGMFPPGMPLDPQQQQQMMMMMRHQQLMAMQQQQMRQNGVLPPTSSGAMMPLPGGMMPPGMRPMQPMQSGQMMPAMMTPSQQQAMMQQQQHMQQMQALHNQQRMQQMRFGAQPSPSPFPIDPQQQQLQLQLQQQQQMQPQQQAQQPGGMQQVQQSGAASPMVGGAGSGGGMGGGQSVSSPFNPHPQMSPAFPPSNPFPPSSFPPQFPTSLQ